MYTYVHKYVYIHTCSINIDKNDHKKIKERAEDKMLFFALSLSTLLLAVSADDGLNPLLSTEGILSRNIYRVYCHITYTGYIVT